MDEVREREHLAQADRHIAEAKTHIAHQKEMIAELERGGHGIGLAVSMLHALEHSLRAFEQHRELILDQLKDSH
jgi:hypothetical protein